MSAIDERPKEALLSDLLPYEAWDPQAEVLWLKDGSATQTFTVTPRITPGMTQDELALIRSGLTTILNQLPDGVFVQFLMLREKSRDHSDLAIQRWLLCHTGTASDENRTQLLHARADELRKECGEGLLCQTSLYVTLRLDAAIQPHVTGKTGPFSQIAFLKHKKTQARTETEISADLNSIAADLQTVLQAQGFETHTVCGAERIEIIYRTLNPERSECIPLKLDFHEPIQDLAEVLALTDFVESRDGLRLGRIPIRLATLKTLPDSSIPALANTFASSVESFALILTVLILPQTAERERLSRKQRLAQGMAAGNRVRNLFAETQLQEIEETLSAMISSGEKLVAASFHLAALNETESDSGKFASLIKKAEEFGTGCQWFEETVGAYPVFFATLPFAPAFMPRPKRMLTSSLSDFLPLFGMPPGHENAEILFESPFGSALGFSLFEKSPSANAILIGSTGSGKSTLAAGIVLGMTAGTSENAPASFIIDVGNSLKRTVLYLNGSSLDLSPEKGTCINPFDLPAGAHIPDPEKVKFLTAFFDEILGDEGKLSKLEQALLETEIIRFYEYGERKTLSGFKDHLETSASDELKRLSKLLSLWCRPHPYGLLFDGETNVALNAPHLHFELKGCQRYPDLLRVAMLVVMDLIWREVRTRFPRRSLIIIDEAHTILRPSGDGRANSAARWVEDCFRQMRKFSSAAIAISQTAKDLKSAEIGDGILANAPNRFILRQRGDERTLREDLKLNPQELEAVFSLSQVRGAYSEFFLHSETIKGVLVYRPTPLELWLSTTHPPDLELLEKEAKAHPDWSLPALVQHMANAYPAGADVSGRSAI